MHSCAHLDENINELARVRARVHVHARAHQAARADKSDPDFLKRRSEARFFLNFPKRRSESRFFLERRSDGLHQAGCKMILASEGNIHEPARAAGRFIKSCAPRVARSGGNVHCVWVANPPDVQFATQNLERV